ncbi:MAG: A/G-specific adenine glycosylase [Pseudonocardiaceae bacterium]
MNPTRLITWFDAHARALPWREPGTTPWGVLVSEVMLQQTPVQRVTGVWTEWLARWPTPSSLAAETPGAAVRAWGKLGYPRRALRLHAAATTIAARHDGVVPDDVDVLLALPGIGAYTARAVAAFAYGHRVPVVDINVRRVVARAVHGMAEAGPPSTSRDLSDVERVLPRARAARFSAALMELGAVVCTARRPRCPDCPVLGECAWVRAGQPPRTVAPRAAQRFAGTDRQVRGLLLDVLRAAADPVPRAQLDAVWRDASQRDRCLVSLLVDGLVEQTLEGSFALPGEKA